MQRLLALLLSVAPPAYGAISGRATLSIRERSPSIRQLAPLPFAEARIAPPAQTQAVATSPPVPTGGTAAKNSDVSRGENHPPSAFQTLRETARRLDAEGRMPETTEPQDVGTILASPGPISSEGKRILDSNLGPMLRGRVIGRDPSAEERTRMERWFPKLAKSDWRVTGEACARMNCFGWALGEGNGASIAGLDTREAVFKTAYGVEPVADSKGADVAEFHTDSGSASHWSRHLTGDWWESKIGGNLRIVHRLRDLEGATYGWAAKFYRRIGGPAGMSRTSPP